MKVAKFFSAEQVDIMLDISYINKLKNKYNDTDNKNHQKLQLINPDKLLNMIVNIAKMSHKAHRCNQINSGKEELTQYLQKMRSHTKALLYLIEKIPNTSVINPRSSALKQQPTNIKKEKDAGHSFDKDTKIKFNTDKFPLQNAKLIFDFKNKEHEDSGLFFGNLHENLYSLEHMLNKSIEESSSLQRNPKSTQYPGIHKFNEGIILLYVKLFFKDTASGIKTVNSRAKGFLLDLSADILSELQKNHPDELCFRYGNNKVQILHEADPAELKKLIYKLTENDNATWQNNKKVILTMIKTTSGYCIVDRSDWQKIHTYSIGDIGSISTPSKNSINITAIPTDDSKKTGGTSINGFEMLNTTPDKEMEEAFKLFLNHSRLNMLNTRAYGKTLLEDIEKYCPHEE